MGNLFVNFGEAIAMLLFVIGFANLLLHKNLVKKIIGLNIMDSAIYLFLAEKGYIAGRGVPIGWCSEGGSIYQPHSQWSGSYRYCS